MQCPVDQSTLTMTERQGVEIDYCPQCRGVWLDRGELDKILERAGPAPSSHESRDRDERDYRHEDRHHNENREHDNYNHHHDKKHKKENFLGELFDF